MGLALVVGLHAALAWALLTGNGPDRRAVEPVRDSVQVLLMEPPPAVATPAAAPPALLPAPALASPARPQPLPGAVAPQVRSDAAVASAPPPVTPAAALPQAVPAAAPAPAGAPQGAAPRADAARADAAGAERGDTAAQASATARATQPSGAAVPTTSAAGPATNQTPRGVGELCPGLVKVVPPARAARAGLGGTVLARASVVSGRVVRVEILRSEPFGLFDAAVRQAMMQYRCHDQGDTLLVAEQLFEFKLAD